MRSNTQEDGKVKDASTGFCFTTAVMHLFLVSCKNIAAFSSVLHNSYATAAKIIVVAYIAAEVAVGAGSGVTI